MHALMPRPGLRFFSSPPFLPNNTLTLIFSGLVRPHCFWHKHIFCWFIPKSETALAALDSSLASRYSPFQVVSIPDFRGLIAMSTIVRVQCKGQVTIPTRLRAQVGLVDGDLVEAKAERGKIVLIPRMIVDREYTPAQRRVIDARLAESLEQAERGHTYGPFNSHKEMVTFLHGKAKKARPKKTTSVKPSGR